MVNLLPAMKEKIVAGQKIRPAAWPTTWSRTSTRCATSPRPSWIASTTKARAWTDLKKKAMAAFDKTYRLVLKVGESFYQLAGLERMANISPPHAPKHLRDRSTTVPPAQRPARSADSSSASYLSPGRLRAADSTSATAGSSIRDAIFSSARHCSGRSSCRASR